MNSNIISITVIICVTTIIIILILTRSKSHNVCSNNVPTSLLEETFKDEIENNKSVQTQSNLTIEKNTQTNVIPVIPTTESGLNDYIHDVNEFRKIDEMVEYDNLTAPVQRYPTNYYPRPPLAKITNIATQGLPDSYSFLGNIYREYDNKIMKLYGRRRYNDFWDYYAVLNSSDNLQTKINLDTKNNKQIFDGDEIKVPMFKEQGDFKVFLNKEDQFAYSPYVF
jgi:hypothetical protein